MRLLIAFTLLCGTVGAADRPNIVWLLSEDNSKHFLRLFDENGAPTPRIAKLAKNGLLFEHAFSNAPVCSVARTTLISGCYAPRIGTQFHRKTTVVPMPPGLRMFPAYLRKAGYYTSNNRKKDYNAREGKGVWDESSARASWRNRAEGQPFFHMQSFGQSHESSLHFSKQSMTNQKTVTDPKSVFVPPIHPKTPTFRYTYARYHDRIMEIDRRIGRVMDQLEKDKLLENTFVFYFGDHGGVLPGSKGYLWETGLHVPLVVRVPEKWKHLVDAKRGTRVKGFVSFVDFAPTVLNLAGVPVPKQMDGKAFLGKGVTLDEVNRRNEAFGHADRFDEKYDFVRTLRVGKFKYMRSYQPFNIDGLQNNYRYRMLAYAEWRQLHRAGSLKGPPRQFFELRPAEALFDLSKDPYETKNLARDPQFSDQVQRMRSRLTARLLAMPDLSFFPESALEVTAFANPVPFGRENRDRIRKLIETADLSLLPFSKAKPRIAQALQSKDPWVRYWAYIVCSSHGKAAAAFADAAKKAATSDNTRLVRVRAAEFLGLTGLGDARKPILKALVETKSGVEATLILNTVVLLRDGPAKIRFDIKPDSLTADAKREMLVKRRLEYLAP